MIADGRGRAVAFALAPGQAHELPMAPGLLDCLPDVPGWVVGDRGLASDGFRERIWDSGALWARLKEWRAVATRYEKTARSFLGVLSLAATCDWLRS